MRGYACGRANFRMRGYGGAIPWMRGYGGGLPWMRGMRGYGGEHPWMRGHGWRTDAWQRGTCVGEAELP